MPADSTNTHFGLVIAYLLPGFVALAGFAPLSPTVARWLSAAQTAGIDASLFAVMAATAAGMIVSCFRWLIVDRVHALTGLGAAAFNARALEERPAAVAFLVENHYRYYQFYANTLVATAWAYAVHRSLGTSPSLGTWTDTGVLVLCAALFAGSRDALSKHRSRSIQLVGQTVFSNPRGKPMTNGIDHNGGAAGHPQSPKPQGKPHPSPAAPAKPQQPQIRREPGAK
jgi:hypothetical protein